MLETTGIHDTVHEMQRSLYTALAVPAVGADPGRTERTADRGETIDNDHVVFDFYRALARTIQSPAGDLGRTEETRTIETIDKDRHDIRAAGSLRGPPADLRAAHQEDGTTRAVDVGRTELTESTETIDWDRPPGWGQRPA